MLDSVIVRYFTLFLCAAMFVVCDVLAANWGKNGSVSSLVTVLILAPVGYVLFGYLNQRYALAVAAGWVVIAISLSTVLIGVFYFGDQLSMRQAFGVVLGLISAALLVL